MPFDAVALQLKVTRDSDVTFPFSGATCPTSTPEISSVPSVAEGSFSV